MAKLSKLQLLIDACLNATDALSTLLPAGARPGARQRACADGQAVHDAGGPGHSFQSERADAAQKSRHGIYGHLQAKFPFSWRSWSSRRRCASWPPPAADGYPVGVVSRTGHPQSHQASNPKRS